MDIEGCPLPEDRLYDLENDVWLAPDTEAGVQRLGVLATLAWFIGRVRAVEFRPVEGVLAAGRSVATLESVRYTGPVRLPLDARLVERNPAVAERPRLVNDSPYDRGWLVRVRPVDPSAAARVLEPAPDVADRLRERVRSLRIRCFPAMPDSELFEIGIECSAILVKLDDELATRAPGDVVLLVTDDPTSRIEMIRWSDETGHSLLDYRREGNLHQFLVRREAHPTPRGRPARSAG